MSQEVSTLWSSSDLALLFVGVFAICALCVLILQPVAVRVGLVDTPDNRKQHIGVVPLVGGVAIAMAVAITLVFSGALAQPSLSVFLVIGAILALVGMLDDFADISARYRLLVEIAIGLALWFYADLKITSIGDIAGNGLVTFAGIASLAFTLMCSVGVFNSINMIDGMDGLAGTVVTFSAGAMAFLAFSGGDMFSAGVLLVVVGSVLAFLMFNLGIFGSSRKVFLGDSGSMFLGFVLLWFFIYLSQGESASMSPVVAGWIFGLPLADTVAVIVGRLIRGESPLAAGRDHIHYRLLAKGFSSRQALVILGFYQFVLVLIGVICNQIPSTEPFLFAGFVGLTFIHFFLLHLLFPHNLVASNRDSGKGSLGR